MIRVPRSPQPPAIPVYVKAVARLNGMTLAAHEQAQAIAFFTDAANFHGGVKLTKNSFSFKVYKDAQLARQLEAVFGGKCAYCDSRFAHVTPKDIEHFRPKSEVDEGVAKLIPGYFWLAGEWENLLVSCPDCNRSRKHTVPGQSAQVRLGKGTQFPLRDAAHRVRGLGPLNGEEGVRLLLNPCVDEPETHLTYDDHALIHPRNGSDMGKASIEVYALQRKALVEERLRVLNEVKFDLLNIARAIEEFGALKEANAPASLVTAKLDDLKRFRDRLKERCAANAPYLGMVRDYIRKTKAAGSFDDFIQNGVDPETLL